MKDILGIIDMKMLGKELQQARVRKGLTQEQAARIIDVARTTMTSIEKGERRIKADELARLASAYNLQMSDFLRDHANMDWSRPQFRGPTLRTEEDDNAISPYVEELAQLARDYFELERMTSAPLLRKYPQGYSIGSLSTREAAESIALEERIRLGLGDGQIPVLRDILEQDVGLRVFYFPLPSKFSAIYLYEEQVGGCIAINSNHPEERRRWSLAHDYGHFLIHRTKPIVTSEDGYVRKPESERLADEFAAYFLMPTTGVTRRFNDIRRVNKAITPADLCTLAHYYGVSVEAMTRRLEDLKLLSAGLWEKLQARGFKVREMQRQLGLKPGGGQVQKLPIRYQYLTIEAFEQKLMSEGMLARFLGVDLLTARSMVENSKGGNMEEEDQAALSDMRDILPTQEDEHDR
jgi:Zn-dependent peptidase ImmA (M78 family)/DNA-binding XRE family transcriptional regulator